jgi:hypothetical protein
MSSLNTINRRTVLSAGMSLVATGASFLFVPKSFAESAGGPYGHSVPMQGGHHADDEMRACIQLCRDCHAMCTQTIAHCLKLGGRHAAPEHIRLLVDCAQMCATTVDYMLRESAFHDRVCRLCAELCRQCGKDCLPVAGDDQLLKQCIEMCRRCAESCERMASKAAA